ncbi:hypothetical protein KIN20_024284 [Parelaphostrongylus tenuis]|uniref:Uncharacterized protein n=1 Tax=Parelaphostrongylus tenuis TaxID=148309 RepID=A0AAD5N809_PARTN|nr:hypothetical protein KIN20_024284 [Parelaphostrongylus tenuis]
MLLNGNFPRFLSSFSSQGSDLKQKRTYVPENRNITKHGMAMEELECSKETPQEIVPSVQISGASTSPVTIASDNTR